MKDEDVHGMQVGHPDGLWARTANLLLSGWLVVSAFAWDGGATRVNAAVVGYLVFVFTLLATAFDGIRALNTLLGVWLLVSVWLLPPHGALMRFNTGGVAVLIVLLSLVSSRGGVRRPPVRTFVERLEGHQGHAVHLH